MRLKDFARNWSQYEYRPWRVGTEEYIEGLTGITGIGPEHEIDYNSGGSAGRECPVASPPQSEILSQRLNEFVGFIRASTRLPPTRILH